MSGVGTMTNERREQEQDAKIAANAEAILLQTAYLHDIRNHFVPEETARMKRFARYVVAPIVKTIALVAFLGGMWDLLAWCLARHEVRVMADRYVIVAKELYYRENNPEIATGFLDRAIELRDGDAEYRFLRAYIEGMGAVSLLLNLDRPFSKDELDRVHHAYAEAKFLEGLKPARAEPYLLQAQVLLALKEVARAEELLEKARALDPDNAFVYLRLAQLKLDFRKDVPGAESDLDRVERLQADNKWLWLWRGILSNDFKKDPVAARACYDRALAIDPKFELAWNNLGWTWMTSKGRDYAKAREAFLKALAVNPSFKQACYAIGMSYGYEDNYAVAKVWLDKAIALDRSFLTAHKWRGIVCGELGRHEEAIVSFDAAIQLDPMNADLYVRRARMAERLGRDDDALRDLRFAYELNPKARRTLMYLGDLMLKTGDAAKALAYYDQALSVDALYDDGHAHRAKALLALKRTPEALAAVEAAIKVSKYKPQRFWMQKADILEGLGRVDEALACCVKARTLDAGFAAAWRKEAALEKGRNPAAYRLALRRYVELAPMDEAARRELQGNGTDTK